MYHYLKWAALGLFFKRNLRYLVLIGVGLVGIYVTDAVYEDLADFAAKAGRAERIGLYLLIKWVAVLLFAALVFFSFLRLGFGGGREKAKTPKTRAARPEEEDRILRRLERFKSPEKLRHRADLVIERRRKKR